MLLCELGYFRHRGKVWWRGAGGVPPRGSAVRSLQVLGHRGTLLCSTCLRVEKGGFAGPSGVKSRETTSDELRSEL